MCNKMTPTIIFTEFSNHFDTQFAFLYYHMTCQAQSGSANYKHVMVT